MTDNGGCVAPLVVLGIVLALFVGECKCLYKAVKCNWEPVGKAEVVYTGAFLTGVGGIIGYIDIEDK